jgi:hypothetical protein
MWARQSKATWVHTSGAFIARFNWGSAGNYYLLYKNRDDYVKGGDYQSFKTIKEAKKQIV